MLTTDWVKVRTKRHWNLLLIASKLPSSVAGKRYISEACSCSNRPKPLFTRFSDVSLSHDEKILEDYIIS